MPGEAEIHSSVCLRAIIGSPTLPPGGPLNCTWPSEGLHLDLRCDDGDDRVPPFPSSKALTLLSAGHPTSFSSLNIGQASTKLASAQ